jgi:hypothetical protein
MILVEPTNIILVEMISNRNDGLAFDLGELPGMGEVTRDIVALFSFAGEICADLFRHNIRKNFEWVD